MSFRFFLLFCLLLSALVVASPIPDVSPSPVSNGGNVSSGDTWAVVTGFLLVSPSSSPSPSVAGVSSQFDWVGGLSKTASGDPLGLFWLIIIALAVVYFTRK